MPTIMTHAFVGIALAHAAQPRLAVPLRVLAPVAALSAVVPDADVLGIPGIELGFGLSHRGFTHSVAFAMLVGMVAAYWVKRAAPTASGLALAALFFAATVSHGLLDGMTNGGPGIAFAAPLSEARHFLPWRPLEVSPIGVRFFSARGAAAMVSEMVWVWVPVVSALLLIWWRRSRVA